MRVTTRFVDEIRYDSTFTTTTGMLLWFYKSGPFNGWIGTLNGAWMLQDCTSSCKFSNQRLFTYAFGVGCYHDRRTFLHDGVGPNSVDNREELCPPALWLEQKAITEKHHAVILEMLRQERFGGFLGGQQKRTP